MDNWRDKRFTGFYKTFIRKNINLKNIILTTVSDYGKKLAEESGAAVKSGAMNKDEMKIFVSQYNIERILISATLMLLKFLKMPWKQRETQEKNISVLKEKT